MSRTFRINLRKYESLKTPTRRIRSSIISLKISRIDNILRYNKVLYISKKAILRAKLISKYYNDKLAKYFEIKKLLELL